MVFDGSVLRDLLIQTPILALLIVFIWVERRDHARTIEAMRAEITKLQQAIIDHMNRLAE